MQVRGMSTLPELRHVQGSTEDSLLFRSKYFKLKWHSNSRQEPTQATSNQVIAVADVVESNNSYTNWRSAHQAHEISHLWGRWIQRSKKKGHDESMSWPETANLQNQTYFKFSNMCPCSMNMRPKSGKNSVRSFTCFFHTVVWWLGGSKPTLQNEKYLERLRQIYILQNSFTDQKTKLHFKNTFTSHEKNSKMVKHF